MIKEALLYIIDMAKPNFRDINGITHTDRKLIEVLPHIPNAPLRFWSLTGFVTYLKDCTELDKFSMTTGFILIESATTVSAVSGLDTYGRRWKLATAEFESTQRNVFPIGEYMGIDTMIVRIKKHFEITEQTIQLLDLISHISQEHTEQVKDNGITQEIVTKRGVNFEQAVTPQFFQLPMRRTFAELGPMESNFFLRCKEQGGNMTAMLNEATFDKWEHTAKIAIAELLEKELAGWRVMI
jgi:hypothetical protein